MMDDALLPATPTYSLTGARNLELTAQLGTWARHDGVGIGTDSATGFVLPNGARRSADAAWTLRSRVAQLDAASRDKYWRLCPDFVIELQSPTDRPQLVREKMQEWMANGARLAWLIDLDQKSVTICRPGGGVEMRTGIDTIAGEGPLSGFVLSLDSVWNPLGT